MDILNDMGVSKLSAKVFKSATPTTPLKGFVRCFSDSKYGIILWICL